MKNKHAKFILSAVILLLVPLLSGCSLSVTSKGAKIIAAADGGIFMSETKGETWTQFSAVPTINGQVRTLGLEDVKDITVDPSDPETLYMAVEGKGLWTTSNIKNGWSRLENFSDKDVNLVRVDPESKCTVYTLSDNQILKTTNCGRDFQQIYQDDNPDTILTTMAIDWYNSRNLYVGNSRGDILKSIDSGKSWRLIKELDSGASVANLIISPQDSRRIFVASKQAEVFSFISNTNTNPANSAEVEANFAVNDWQDFNSVLNSLNLGRNYRDLVIANNGTLFFASKNSIARSKDQGITWEKLNILTTTDAETSINALAINQDNPDEIYFVTNNTLFRSTDGGVSWNTKKLSTNRIGSKLLVNYQNPSIIYLGISKD
ncbi:MAG: hypothetical protein PHR57_04040 [Patescibacteria group bacterium]|nr:hypothetical protein [Patescibacteria group bacterium]